MDYRHAGEEICIWPCGAATIDPPFCMRLWQHLRSWSAGDRFDEITDHSIDTCESHVYRLTTR